MLDFSGETATASTNDIVEAAFAGLQFANDGSIGRSGQFSLSGNAITLDGDITTATMSSGTITDTLGMGLTLSGDRVISTGASHGLTIAGAIAGAGLTKEGAGSLTLSATNTFTGPLTVNAGTVTLTNSSTTNSWETTVINAGVLRAFGRESLGGKDSTATVNAGTLDLRNFNAALDRNVVFNGTGRLTLALTNTGTFRIGSLTLPGSGTLTITSQANAGATTMTHTLPNPLALNGTGSLYLEPINSSGNLTTLRLTGGITDEGTNLVRKISTGAVLLESDVRNRGETRLSNGFVRLGKDEALASGAGFGNVRMNPVGTATALLQLNGFSQTLNGISNDGAGRSILTNDADAGGTLTLGANDADGSFSGEIRDVSGFSGDFTGTLSLVKTGTGTLTLSGPSSMAYTGGTSVQGGTLSVLTTQASSAAPVTVAATGTIAGSGTLEQLAIEPGGTLAPGDGLGTLATTQGVTWASGASYNWQIADAAGTGGTGWDLLNIGGSLTIGSTAAEPFAINLWSLSQAAPPIDGPAANFDPAQPYAWTIASAAGGITGFASDTFLVRTAAANGTAGFANSFGTGRFSVAQAGNDLQVVFTPGSPSTDIVIDVPSGSQTQAEAGYPAIGSATSVTKTGAGRLVMDAANAYTGPTTVSAGTLEVADAAALAATPVTVDTAATLAIASGTTMKSPSVIVDGGTLSASSVAVNTTTGIASLAINAGTIAGSPTVTIAAGGQMALVQDARVTVGLGGLSVEETSGGGRLDLGAGRVHVAAGGISASDLRADIIAGRNNGAWNGATGIMSTAAAASGGTRAVGYAISGDGSAQVSYAAAGDVDLSGQVNVFDLVSVNSSGTYGTGGSAVWSQGDFNYDGVTNVFDLVGINTAAVYGQGNYFPAVPSGTSLGSVAAVPEPAPWLLAALGAGSLTMVRVLRPRRSSGR